MRRVLIVLLLRTKALLQRLLIAIFMSNGDIPYVHAVQQSKMNIVNGDKINFEEFCTGGEGQLSALIFLR